MMNSTLVFSLILTIARLYNLLTIKKCKVKRTMVGKVVIVTGANSGIGFETAKELASRGGRVILACRSEERGAAARDKIIQETGNENVVYRQLDLSSLASVRTFAKHIVDTEQQLHVLINNAGIHGFSDVYTVDDIVASAQINYLAPFLLTLLLLPLLKKSKPSRIINVSSVLHFFGNIDLPHINDKGYYSAPMEYCNSKLCIVILTKELSRRLVGSGVVVNAVHPGVILTNLARHSNFFLRAFFVFGCFIIGRTVQEGAQTSVFLATASECENVSGAYFVDCAPSYASPKASDLAAAKQLWQYSLNIVGFKGEV